MISNKHQPKLSMKECQKEIIGATCKCKICKPRSDKQLANDKRLRYRAAKRARMEELPAFVEDLRNEVNIDPFIDSIAPDPLIEEIGYHEYTPHERGDFVNNQNVFPKDLIYKVGSKYLTWRPSRVAGERDQ